MRLTLAATLSLAQIAFASEGRGIVKFGGLPLPGATVVASQGGTKFEAVTNENGAYYFKELADGVWNERVEMLGFTPARQDVNVGFGAPGPVWELKMLSFAELKAMVPAAPPTPPSAPPASAGVSVTKNEPAPKTKSTFRKTDVQASSSEGAAPAAAIAADQSAIPPAPSDSSDSFAINGSSNNGAASVFSLSPAFGNNRRGPGSVYNGNIGVTFGNSALDARPFSITGQDTPKAAYNHVQADLSFGGPLRVPHVSTGSSPVNFFVAYQILRNRNASTVTSLVPTLAQRNGDGIAPNLISPQAQALLRFYPLPNFSGTRYNYQTSLLGITHSDNFQTRLAKQFGRANQVFGTFAYQDSRGDNTNLFGFKDRDSSSGIDLTANLIHRFNQRTFGTFRYQFNRLASRLTPFFAGVENVSGTAGITGNNQDPLNWGPPSLNFSSGIASLNDPQQSFNRFQTQAIGGSVYWSHSPHNLTLGGDYKRQQFNYLGQQDARGSFTFTGADFDHFLLDTPDTSSIAFGNADKYFRASVYDVYGTDDWRVNPSLTVNGGVRWEYNAPGSEKYGRLVNLAIGPGFATEHPVIGNNLLNPYRRGFQPRIGISWRPLSGSSLVVRSGYGITQDTSVYQSIAVRMAQQSPLSKSLSVQSTAANPLTLANGFIASPASTPNTFAADPDFRPGYAQSWHLQVQRDLPWSLVVSATYLGIKGTRAQQVFLPNTYPTGAIDPCPSCEAGYAYLSSNGNSTKQSGQLQLRRRLHAGLTATLQYTWSKALDNAALGGRGQGGQVIAQNWLNLSGERGLSPFDERHLLNVQTQYTHWDWTLATQITAGTGFPLSPTVIAAVNGTGVTGPIRPDYTGANLYDAPAGLFLNPAAYRVAAPGQWGNAGRNSITGPGRFALNTSLARTFRLKDRLNMDIRFDSLNTLNHVTYPGWNTVVNSPQFGVPNQANPMRNVTATAKLRF